LTAREAHWKEEKRRLLGKLKAANHDKHQLRAKLSLAEATDVKGGDGEMVEFGAPAGGTTVVNHNHFNLTNCNVTIVPYGEEDKGKLSRMFLDQIAGRPFGAIQRMVSTVHLDPEVPQNKTIVVTNAQGKYVRVSQGDGTWKLADKKQIIGELVAKNYDILDEHWEDAPHLHENRFKARTFQDFRRQFTSEGSKHKRDIQSEVALLLYNGSQPSGGVGASSGEGDEAGEGT